MNLKTTEFKRKFSMSMYKNLRLSMAEMTFAKDFINDTRGDLYPLLEKTEYCCEEIFDHIYRVMDGAVRRYFCQYFPYATYEVTAGLHGGHIGFAFVLPNAEASVILDGSQLVYHCGGREEVFAYRMGPGQTLIVSCRPGAFDVYGRCGGDPVFLHTFSAPEFACSNDEKLFSDGYTALLAADCKVFSVSSYIDNGVSIADIRPIRYEDGSVMVEQGKIYLTASIRMQAEMFQGVFSWVPGTAEFALTGALFYNSGDGKWCGDVAASMLYHREQKRWLLWVCAFSHGHILGHASFDGDVRHGVNVIDIELMPKGTDGDTRWDFLRFGADEDPDFFYDAAQNRWLMAICRSDPENGGKYRYAFFSSDSPFDGYTLIGRGLPGAETGGSFVRVDGKQYFICGNDFNLTSNYRIYDADGMTEAKFNFPDGGFRGWGTVIPVKQGTRTRYYWLTFDRHKGSDYNWSYGNLYCFEGYDF